MSSSAINIVPLLDGSNYQTWKSSMMAYLRFQKLSGIISGRVTHPDEHRSPTTAEISANTYTANAQILITDAAHLKSIADWDDLNDSAQGAIGLCLPDHIRQTATKNTAQETWNHLETIYGTPGTAGMYGIF